MIVATSILFPFVSAAAAIVMMLHARDLTFSARPCEQCGERGEHLVGCPGRRGY